MKTFVTIVTRSIVIQTNTISIYWMNNVEV